jgi:hypothetical protein
MPVQLVGFSYGPFILLAIPGFCSYEPQTPNLMIYIPSSCAFWIGSLIEGKPRCVHVLLSALEKTSQLSTGSLDGKRSR